MIYRSVIILINHNKDINKIVKIIIISSFFTLNINLFYKHTYLLKMFVC